MEERTNKLKERLRATIVMASLLGATAGFVAALGFADAQPNRVMACDRGAPVKSAVCLVQDAVRRYR